jgi:ubiquitin-conjugating enzyme E2 D/E
MKVTRIEKELSVLNANTIPNISAKPKTADKNYWEGIIIGPVDTPYSGGIFNLSIFLPPDYPYKPPIIKFTNKIFHPNIDADGNICLDILKDQWSPALTITKVLLSISALLDKPNPHDPLSPDIAKLYIEDIKAFNKKAREYTEKYA